MASAEKIVWTPGDMDFVTIYNGTRCTLHLHEGVWCVEIRGQHHTLPGHRSVEGSASLKVREILG